MPISAGIADNGQAALPGAIANEAQSHLGHPQPAIANES
jgi:hypothetical protein